MLSIDRERALVTARSVLANVDVLEGEGLDNAGQAKVIEIAEQLAAGTDPASIEDAAVGDLARELRETLGIAPGKVTGIYMTWLDEVLDAEG